MGQVSVTGPYNNNPVDADVMRAILEVLAGGINNVDSTQIASGAILEAAIGNQEVSMAKLKAGQFAYRASLSLENGTEYSAGALTFNGGSSSTTGARFGDATWKLLMNSYYDWRAEDGSPFVITPPQNCYGIILATISTYVDTGDADRDLVSVKVGISNRNQSETPSDGTMVAVYVQDMEETDISKYSMNATLVRFAPLNAGQSYRLCPAMRIDADGSLASSSVKLYAGPSYSSMGVILLPR